MNEVMSHGGPSCRGTGARSQDRAKTTENTKRMNHLVCDEFNIDNVITRPSRKLAAGKLETNEGYQNRFPQLLTRELSMVNFNLIPPIVFHRQK